jgi:hypothetical protein
MAQFLTATNKLVIGSASGAASVVTGMVAYYYLRRMFRAESFPVGSKLSYAHTGEDVLAYEFLNDPM